MGPGWCLLAGVFLGLAFELALDGVILKLD
jgi:hypothetical protein